MNKIGRPKIQIDLALLEKLCTIQCTDSEIAACLNVSIETIDKRKQSDPEFLQIYKKAKETGKMSLRRKMYEMANNGNVTLCIWLSKQYLGMSDKQEIGGHGGGDLVIKVKHVKPEETNGTNTDNGTES